MFKYKILLIMDYLGLDRKDTQKVVDHMNILLADYHIYYQKLRNFHWNVQGNSFFDLHNKFEELYNDARLVIDEVAERILTLRHRPLSTINDYLGVAKVKEVDGQISDHEMVEEVLKDHKILIEDLRATMRSADDAGDEGSTDLAAGVLKDIEKRSWMLDAWRTKGKTAPRELVNN